MGLDLTAYADIKLIKDSSSVECIHVYQDQVELPQTVVLITNKHFTVQSEGLVDGLYSYSDCYGDFGCSYGNWSVVRNLLSRLAGNNKARIEDYRIEKDDSSLIHLVDMNGNLRYPYQLHTFGNKSDKLHLLINFSDCEGVINHESCVIIYNELKEFWDNAKEDLYFKDYERQLERLFKTFEFAALNSGVVNFS